MEIVSSGGKVIIIKLSESLSANFWAFTFHRLLVPTLWVKASCLLNTVLSLHFPNSVYIFGYFSHSSYGEFLSCNNLFYSTLYAILVSITILRLIKNTGVPYSHVSLDKSSLSLFLYLLTFNGSSYISICLCHGVLVRIKMRNYKITVSWVIILIKAFSRVIVLWNTTTA